MITLKELQQRLAAIKELKPDEVKACKMPIGIYLHEADRLYAQVMSDWSEMKAGGMPLTLLQKLQERTDLLREAELLWQAQNVKKDADQEAWKSASAEMYVFYKELQQQMTFAYRKHPDLLQRLKSIKKKRTHAQVIQNLRDLSVLGKKHLSPLLANGFDVAILDEAVQVSFRMHELYATARMSRYTHHQEKLLRDQAYCILKEVVDEVRSYGKFIFRDEPDHVHYYASQYRRERKQPAKPDSGPIITM